MGNRSSIIPAGTQVAKPKIHDYDFQSSKGFDAFYSEEAVTHYHHAEIISGCSTIQQKEEGSPCSLFSVLQGIQDRPS